MKRIDFNRDWKRAVGAATSFWSPNKHPVTAVNLPDDYIITLPRSADACGGASTGFFPGGRAVYTKKFDVPEDWQDRTVLLDIDGAYMNAEVNLNGEVLGVHPYGYTPWQLDLKDAMIPGEENHLEIVTRCVQPNSRWYSGGGLYRQVHLWTGPACHIRPWDLFVHSEAVTKRRALVHIDIVITNDAETPAQGTVTALLDGQKDSEAVSIPAKGTTTRRLTLSLSNPKLWSAESPHLYPVQVTLDSNLGRDVSDVTTGIRSVEIDARQGMRVNGTPVKLLGGCIHHDNALLGAAAFPRAEERKVEKLKALGYNSLRFAHNPPSAAMLAACDRLGMYVIDETFDCWRLGKNDLDYHLYFEDWWQRDTTAMVCRDRNHPSIFCWSIGNELREQGGESGGYELTRLQASLVRSLDPTRPVTSAIHSMIYSKREKGKPARMPFQRPDQGEDMETTTAKKIQEIMADPNAVERMMARIATNNMGNGFVGDEDVWAQLSEPSAAHLDLVGYNYFFNRYALDREKYPDRVILGTETHAATTYDYYQAMMANPHVIGDYIWTAYDNMGEAGAGREMHGVQDIFSGMLGSWPWLSCYQGDLDLDGNRRPQSYYRKIMWGMDPGLHLFSKDPRYPSGKSNGLGWQWSDVFKRWNWDEAFIGKEIYAEAYGDFDEVEFILNGKSLGKVPVKRLIAGLVTRYQPGSLKAVGYKNGIATAEDLLTTAGAPSRIELTADRCTLRADGTDLSFVTARITDDRGITVPADDIALQAEVTGGILQGFGSGNPCTDENFGTGKRRVWNGLALLCLRAPLDPGTIRLTVKGERLPAETITVVCR